MRVVFRTDASLDIGIGHAMRCLTLAEALRAHGANCYFICREHSGHVLDLIREHGFPANALPDCPRAEQAMDENCPSQPAHAHWLDCDWQTDARQTAAILAELRPDWLVVDHYALDDQWEQSLRGNYTRLLVIDDLADRHHACDVLLDQNLGRDAADYAALVPDYCRRLVGPQYALLRPEFAALREYSLGRREMPVLKRVLITMGGVDQPNATGRVLDALKDCPLPQDCGITVVMGAKAPWIEQIHALAASLPWPTEVRVNISDMAEVMADSDLAIGAAGSTSWERCCLGLPSLLVVLAENQLAGSRALYDRGAALLLGEPGEIQQQLAATISTLLAGNALAEMSLASRAVTDGLGTYRVAQHMEHQS